MPTRDSSMPNRDAHFHADLEPRVATVESQVESINVSVRELASDIKDLASIIRNQAAETDRQIGQLTVAVANAQAPRKTDWSTLMGGVALMMAIGTAAFSPMLLRINDAQSSISGLDDKLTEHMQLPMHQVGEVKVAALERMQDERVKFLENQIKELDVKLQKEFVLVNATIREQISTAEKKLEEVKVFGSPITRERLAIIEERLGIGKAAPKP